MLRGVSEIEQVAKSAALRTLSTLHRPQASARFRRDAAALAAGDDLLKVNIGAATKLVPGWMNTDVHYRAPYYLDLLKPWPVPPQSVDRVFADNVIEHFTIADARTLLRHAFDAMAPGGGIRLVTPDVERIARAYLDDLDLATRHLDRHRRHGYVVHYPVDLLRVTFAESGHHLGFCHDFASLSAEVAQAGFGDVVRREAGKSDDEAFSGIEQRVGDTEAATTLVIEAWKPA